MRVGKELEPTAVVSGKMRTRGREGDACAGVAGHLTWSVGNV